MPDIPKPKDENSPEYMLWLRNKSKSQVPTNTTQTSSTGTTATQQKPPVSGSAKTSAPGSTTSNPPAPSSPRISQSPTYYQQPDPVSALYENQGWIAAAKNLMAGIGAMVAILIGELIIVDLSTWLLVLFGIVCLIFFPLFGLIEVVTPFEEGKASFDWYGERQVDWVSPIYAGVIFGSVLVISVRMVHWLIDKI